MMDYSIIKQQFDEVIKYSQDIDNPQTDYLFKEWETNKKFFFDLFGDNLIYECQDKVTFELDEKQKKQRLLSFCLKLEDTYGYTDLADFVQKQAEGFFDNITVNDYQAWDGKLIKSGTKLVKSFKHFIIDNRSLHDIQSEASRIIQENKIEGNLCFSVHPLDFLSLSENNYNWRSCHALDGGYRAGNLSYMMDDVTFICYLKGQDGVQLPNFPIGVPWNGKKWRTLFFLDKTKSIFFAGRSYPFTSSTGLDLARNEIVRRLGTSFWSYWVSADQGNRFTDKLLGNFEASCQVWTDDGFRSIEKVIQDCKYPAHYNDLLYSSVYQPEYCFRYITADWLDNSDITYVTKNTELVVGHEVHCLNCGETIQYYPDEGSMLCDKCLAELHNSDDWYYCDCCDRAFHLDELTEANGYRICRQCLKRSWTRCEECGAWTAKAEIIYNHILGEYICKKCDEENS